jgi:uncharacterized protein (TIGR03437 family)
MKNTFRLRAIFLMGLSLGGLVFGQPLRPAVDGDRSIGAGITAPVAADFNNDGRLDLAVHGVTEINVYLGNGDGAFLPPVVTPLNGTETRILYHAATAGDFNRDGKIDLVAYGRYFEGNGDGGFNYVGPSAMEHHLETLELNSDATWGVAGYTTAGAYGLSLGERPNQTYMTVDAPYAAPWFLADDITPYGIVSTGSTAGSFSLGKAEGLGSARRLVILTPFGGALHVGLVGTGGLRVFRVKGGMGLYNITGLEEVQTRRVAGVLSDVAFIDVDGGSSDLLAAQVDGSRASIGYYSGEGAGFAPFMPLYTFPVTDPNVTLTIGDWNRDGRLDIVTQDGVSVRLYLGKPVVSAASAESRIAPGSLATVYGLQLAAPTEAADLSKPLPSQLGGVRVSLRDAIRGTQHDARLLYVSPTQVNFEVPATSAEGSAAVIIDDGTQHTIARATVSPVAPALFTYADNTPISYLLRVEPDGSVTALSSRDPIVLDSRPVYFVLYGTGIRNRTSLAEVSVKIGNQTISADYAGPDGAGLPGLDQVNVRLPLSLMGSGSTTLTLTVNGFVANRITVNIQ